MEHDKKVDVRIPGELRGALERERKRISKAAGVEVKTSAVIRSILERALKKRKTIDLSVAAR